MPESSALDAYARPEVLIPIIIVFVMKGVRSGLPDFWKTPTYARIEWAIPGIVGALCMLLPGLGGDLPVILKLVIGVAIGAVTAWMNKGYRQGVLGHDDRIRKTAPAAEPSATVGGLIGDPAALADAVERGELELQHIDPAVRGEVENILTERRERPEQP